MAVVVLAGTMALLDLSAQTAKLTKEKLLLIQTLQDLTVELDLQGHDDPAAWLRKAAERWQPTQETEGQRLRESLQLMLRAIRRARKENRLTEDLKSAVTEDLEIKTEHCRSLGLSAEQNVEVKTKRQGMEEVKGLEVWYLEKFLALDKDAHPHRFRRFSSPVSDTIVPGVYLFWAQNPVSGTAGEKREQRVSGLTRSGQPLPIELLAP